MTQSTQKGLFSIFYDEKIDLEVLKYKSEQLLFVKGYSDEVKVWQCLETIQKNLQGAALEAPAAEREKFACRLSELGVNRICRLGELQKPSLFWHHDGKHSLLPLVFWTDLE